MKIVTVIDKNSRNNIYVQEGENLLDVLRKNGYLIFANCGGNGSCKKCKVKYYDREILSCQTIIDKDMEIELIYKNNRGLELGRNRDIEFEKRKGYGIALDLGTTTIAAYLLNLENGLDIASYSMQNLQSSYGADVISRIKKCQEGMLNELHNTIVKQINQIIEYFKKTEEINEIEELVISGNTTMLHILANVDPSPLGVAPFIVPFLDKQIFLGKKIGLNVNKVLLLPSISAYIGSDIVSGILACKMYEDKGNILLIDIGTNGEIILKANNKFYGTSTAAGPAFEGAKIEFGMGGVPGAITRVVNKCGSLILETINNERPQGICGSALVDIISILVKEKIIDETGLFYNNNNNSLCKRLKEKKFYLNNKIYVSQNDIREFQLAKSAIKSGIETLIDYAKIQVEEIDKLYIAGGFGFYMDIQNACSIGLLPKKLLDKTIVIGNSSGLGAKMVLLNSKYIKICDTIYPNVEVVELSNNPKFTNYFIENMLFN